MARGKLCSCSYRWYRLLLVRIGAFRVHRRRNPWIRLLTGLGASPLLATAGSRYSGNDGARGAASAGGLIVSNHSSKAAGFAAA